MNEIYGDYIVFADESGDHSLAALDPEYPIFVLVLVVFRCKEYFDHFLPKLHRLKFNAFGHDSVILHEREIRRREGAFRILHDGRKREKFLGSLNELISETSFEVIHWVFDKRSNDNGTTNRGSIYGDALRATLPNLLLALGTPSGNRGRVPLIFESRGRSEDKELAADFVAFQSEFKALGSDLLELHFVSKSANTAGIQLADLTARPLGLADLQPRQRNRALEIVLSKVVLRNDL